jgi:hypothetical protein|tara:strand:- start:455 stop:1192 length:738 start_codon:yes stop_codon:yes gene_type:complete
MSDVFLKAWHGGLGDALQFSTLPEEFYKQQGRKTYIVEDAPFRNPEIYDLVWDKNPYVHGKKAGVWNAGDLAEIPYQQLCMDGKGTGNMISNWELFHGLKPVNTHPKIYYEPEIHDGFKDVFIVDYTSTTIDYDQNELKRILEDTKKEYPDKRFLSVDFVKSVSSNSYDIDYDGYVEVESIFRYCDLIASSYGILTLSSGASHMSSAIKDYSPDLKSICVMSKKWYNYHKERGLFFFDNVDYVTY